MVLKAPLVAKYKFSVSSFQFSALSVFAEN